MITISLCMIVKNEERVLSRCLDSLKGLMDEIIIVDTGSADRTKEIALMYTDKVYDFKWCDDFSAARNYASSFASCDYIYTADADEILDEENRRAFMQLKQVLMPQVDIVQMLYSGQYESNTVYNFNEEYRAKLFKRIRTFEFKNPIHECLRIEPIVFDSDIRIFHKPHGLHTDRDIAIFEKNFGNEDSPVISYDLARMYAKELYISGTDKQFTGAIGVFERLLKKEGCTADELQYACIILSHAYRIMRQEDKFFKYAMKVVLSDGCSEICMELGDYYKEKGDLDEAHLWYYNAAFETTPVCNIHMGGDRALNSLADVLDMAGLKEQAEEYRRQAEMWQENLLAEDKNI